MTFDPSPALEVRHAATDRPTIVVIAERRLLAIDGVGGPSGSDYRLAADTLRAAVRQLRDRLARERKITTRQGILETAWWMHPELPAEELADAFADRSRWHWQQMFEVPEQATDADVDGAVADTRGGAGRAEPLLHVISLTEGRAAQMLHLGGTSTMVETLRALFRLLASSGERPHGHIHELRVADEADVPAGRARSILRVPIASY
jgi:hypothetical protein